MRINIELDKTVLEPEVTIRCGEIDEQVRKLQFFIADLRVQNLTFYKDGKEYYLPLDAVLFFETQGSQVYAHDTKEVYRVKLKLYELETVLSAAFLRVSKSAIINVNQVYSIERNIASFSLVQFYNSHKQVSVSRFYFPVLKQKLKERSLL